MDYFLYFVASAILAIALTPLVKRLAYVLGCIDMPGDVRKIHKKPIPLLGGLSVFFAVIIILLVYLNFGRPNFDIVPLKFFSAIVLGGLILMVGGIFDDKYTLPPKVLWLFPALAALVVVMFGIGVGITFITNPFGGTIPLDFLILGVPLPGIIIWFWMMGMMFTTKLLDGLDGLASGIAGIAGMTMFFLSLTEKVNQPITAHIAIIFAGSILGYLIFAFNPASIFLGEGGSTFLGFMLGVLAVISGAKIATALLVMGIPVLDVAWAIVRRLYYGRSPFSADRKHLHFRLLDIGFSQRQAVLILYGISAVFGFTAVFLQSRGKLIALGVLFCLMIFMVIALVLAYKRKYPHIPGNVDSKGHI